MILSLVVLLCWQVLLSPLVEAQCRVNYTEQPPTSLECNPYDTALPGAFLHVRFACTVRTTPKPDGELNLTWFQKTTDGQINDLGCPIHAVNRLNAQRCILDLVGEHPPAEYWCQAMYRTSSGNQPLLRSSVATIGSLSQHSGSQCDNTQSTKTIKCAVLPIVNTTATTEGTSPSPTTTTTSTTTGCTCVAPSPSTTTITSSSASISSSTSSSSSSTSSSSSSSISFITASSATASSISSTGTDAFLTISSVSSYSPSSTNYPPLCTTVQPGEEEEGADIQLQSMVIIATIVLGFIILLTMVAVMCSCLYYYKTKLTKLQAKKGVDCLVRYLPENLESSSRTNTPKYVQPYQSYEDIPCMVDGQAERPNRRGNYMDLQVGTMDYTNIYTMILSSDDSSGGSTLTQAKGRDHRNNTAMPRLVAANRVTHSDLNTGTRPHYANIDLPVDV